MQIDELLRLMVDKKASDLHLKIACMPAFRIDGALIRQGLFPPLDLKDTEVAKLDSAFFDQGLHNFGVRHGPVCGRAEWRRYGCQLLTSQLRS